MTYMRTPHYYVRLDKRLDPDVWLETAAALKQYMRAQGFELDEFGDSDETDREAVRASGPTNEFEGQVVAPATEAWQEDIVAFFRKRLLDVVESEFD
jgi:hypothetical protein